MFFSLSRIIKRIFRFIIFVLVMSLVVGLVISFVFPIGYKDYINKYSKQYDIDPFLVAAVINVESKFNKEAISQKDARGFMQIGPQTGEWAAGDLGISNYSRELLFEPEINIRIGIWYLNQLKQEFNNDINLVLAAYNAGSGNVNKWLENKDYSKDGINLSEIPFKETEDYLERVNFNYKIYSIIYKSYMEKPDSMNSLYTDVIISIRTYLRDTLKSLRQGGIF